MTANAEVASRSPESTFSLGMIQDLFLELFLKDRAFLAVVGLALVASAVVLPYPEAARWLGFALATYSAVGNDSIQTIGTFIASNSTTHWAKLWLFIAGIWVVTVAWSWFNYNGDISFERLTAKGFETAPTSFSYLQIAAPAVLLILTRLKMPVSTTFLLLSGFSTSATGIWDMLVKSVSGYGVAFVTAFVLWMLLSHAFQRWFQGEAHPGWRVGQWVSSGLLWSVWIQQDAANVAVYLPRQITAMELIPVLILPFFGLGLLFWQGGEKIQQVVNEKSAVVDVRPATVIDFVYAIILYVFKELSNVPMSTTWVFIGLLGGRELAMALRRAGDYNVRQAAGLLAKDLTLALIGLAVSIVIALAVNEALRKSVFGG